MSRGRVCAFIATEKTTYGVRCLCPEFAISPTTFYAWARPHGGPTDAELADAYAVNERQQRPSVSRKARRRCRGPKA